MVATGNGIFTNGGNGFIQIFLFQQKFLFFNFFFREIFFAK
jgi:hypothetical protein